MNFIDLNNLQFNCVSCDKILFKKNLAKHKKSDGHVKCIAKFLQKNQYEFFVDINNYVWNHQKTNVIAKWYPDGVEIKDKIVCLTLDDVCPNDSINTPLSRILWIDEKQLSQYIDFVIGIDECPICYNNMNAIGQSILECGHKHCKYCVEKIRSCSLCREPIGTNNDHQDNDQSLEDIEIEEEENNVGEQILFLEIENRRLRQELDQYKQQMENVCNQLREIRKDVTSMQIEIKKNNTIVKDVTSMQIEIKNTVSTKDICSSKKYHKRKPKKN